MPKGNGHAGHGLRPLFPLPGGRGASLQGRHGVHAERTAIFKAVSEGHRDFDTIVIAGRSNDYCVPCGTCRQVMMEFAPDMTVICLNKSGESKRFALKELLPYGFDQTWL